MLNIKLCLQKKPYHIFYVRAYFILVRIQMLLVIYRQQQRKRFPVAVFTNVRKEFRFLMTLHHSACIIINWERVYQWQYLQMWGINLESLCQRFCHDITFENDMFTKPFFLSELPISNPAHSSLREKVCCNLYSVVRTRFGCSY